jgi:DNA polymerase I-like protein with 3'-5' exonuclease and polymerase domains
MLGKFVFETLGFQHQGLNADGEYVVDDDVLQSFGKKDPIHPDKIEWAHPVFPDMIEYRQLSKFLGTYSEGFLRYVRDDGRVHPQFRPDGARTGRLSCVAPWTQVLTSKGPTPIVGIRPGDLVMTHRGRYKPVLRFIEQGTQPVYTIKLNNGQALTCTSSHRVLTPEGRWVSTQELYDEYQQSMVSVSLKLSTSRTAIKGYNNISSDYRDTQIEGIYHSGNCAVYDLSVADDESYLTEGVFSHNCTEPALQTVPSAEDDVRALMIRRAFVSLPGWSLLKYDFSQLEYKVAAWRSNDPFMIAGFIRGEDIHTITTKAICKYMWGIEPADWDTQPEPTKKSQRKVGKTLNFALMFGMGDEKLALTLGIDKEKAEELRAALMGNYTGYAAFKAWCEQESMRTGYARTAWWDEQGNVIPFRKRQAQQIGSKQRKLQSQGMRIATNTAIQGLASDLCLNALIRIQQWIEDESLPIEIICTIHDALFFHIPNHLVAYAAPIIKHFMEDYNCGGVPITVDGEIGQNWADMIKYTDEIGEYLTTTTSIAEYVETPSYKAYLASKKKAA